MERLSNLFLCSLFLHILACGGSESRNPTGPFSLIPETNEITVVEGEYPGATVHFNVQRDENSKQPLFTSVEIAENEPGLIAELSSEVILLETEKITLDLTLPLSVRPIKPYVTQLIVNISDDLESHSYTVSINVQPTTSPDVYLLIGQSNMEGYSNDGTKRAGPGQIDEPHERIFQLNVTPNIESQYFFREEQYTDINAIALHPRIVQAEDPLHIPADPASSFKSETSVGLGLSFAKRALSDSTADIILVPAAWPGTSFCLGGGFSANWNANNTDHSSLGNTRLFDRAVARTNLALTESGGILRGILWHQGENDADPDYPECADLYQDNLSKMVSALRSRIQTDSRGEEGRVADGNIPFVLGTMSRGNGDFFDPLAQKIDNVHRNVMSFIPFSGVSIHDDLIPENGFPCGKISCIHFGADALREIGVRYYEAMLRAVEG